MKNTISRKIRMHTLFMVFVSTAAFILIIAAGTYAIRQTVLSASSRLGDSAAEDARRALIEQTVTDLMNLVENRAALSDSRLLVIQNSVEMIAHGAEEIARNPERYKPNPVPPPDAANKGVMAAQFVRAESVNSDDILEDAALMGNVQDLLLNIISNNISATTNYIGTERGYAILVDEASDAKGEFLDPRERPWYKLAVENGGLSWTDAYTDAYGRGLAITCAKPYYDETGTIAGVAGIGAVLDELTEIVIGTRIGETGYAFMTNELGQILISEDLEEDEDGNIILESLFESADEAARNAAARLIRGESGVERVTVGGTEKFIAFCGLEIIPWSLAVIIDADEILSTALEIEENIIGLKRTVLASVDEDIFMIVAITGVILIIIIPGVAVLSARLAKIITDPIQKLTEGAVLIGGGDLKHVLEVRTGDELERLANAFNSMIVSVKTLTVEKERIERTGEEKEREAEIVREAHRNLQTTIEMMPVGVSIISIHDWSVLYANNAALMILGLASFEEQVKGRRVFEFLPEKQPDARRTTEVIREIVRKNTAVAEIQCRKLNGDPFIARANFSRINFQGVRSILAEFEDMTAEREYQEMLRNAALREHEANQLKSRFLATVSHEIRTPMNAIIGITEIQLQNEKLPEDILEAFDKIHESGNLLMGIINDILDMSKIEEGKLEITQNRYDLPSLIHDTAQINHPRYESKPVEFIVRVDENTPLQLIGDELRIKQVLNNLLSNAFKYTAEGEVELSVSAEPWNGDAAAGDAAIVFRVRDTGQGMSREQMGRLFEEYTRFNPDVNQNVTGTGLGLNITKRLVDMMNGEICVESEPRKGSTITVHLPQKRAGSEVCGAELTDKLRAFRYRSVSKTRRARLVREYMPYGSVLVVDDVASNLYVAKGLLLPYGMRIDTAGSGFEAVDKIKAGNTYDIILMDHMMPKMDGMETARIIRGMGYDRPIVALTANTMTGQAEKFLADGFDAFISKPVDNRELNAVLLDLVRDKHPPEVIKAARRERDKKEMNKTPVPPENAVKRTEVEEAFVEDAENAAAALDDLCARMAELGGAEMETYEITVHGMKSALTAIGETELSAAALRLEQAAIQHDLALISGETPAFVRALRSLIMKLNSLRRSSQ